MAKHKYFLILTLILSVSLFSAEEERFTISSIPLHIRISEMGESEEPFIFGEKIIFSYTPSRKSVKHVGIAFHNEDFSKIHSLYRNENGIFFYIYHYPNIEGIDYRFIEDGVWIINDSFKTLSSFKIPQSSIKELNSPIVNGSKVTFKYREAPGSSLYLTGDFNNWNPFLYPMKEEEDGLYTITLTLPIGKYGYYFISNGERRLDRENFLRGYSRIGEEVSILEVGK